MSIEREQKECVKDLGEDRLRICFVAPEIYPVLASGSGIDHVGGMEVQQKLLGFGLARLGHDVHFITRDYGQPDQEQIGNVTVHKAFRQTGGLPGIRFLRRKLPELWRVLQHVDADIYYVRGSGYLIAPVTLFARRAGRCSVFAAAHDWDVDPARRRFRTRIERYLYHFGLRRANAVVVQSLEQQRLLQASYDRYGEVIRSAWSHASSGDSRQERHDVLWVGMFRREKRPMDFLQLAAAHPDDSFVMVGGPVGGQEELFHAVKHAAEQLPNLHFAGFQSVDEVGHYFGRARVLVSTSLHEGFPNTFLQAWAQGVPVCSRVDPDGVIERYGLGCCAPDPDALSRSLGRLLASPRPPLPGIREYFNDHHGLAGALASYQQLFTALRAGGRGRPAGLSRDDPNRTEAGHSASSQTGADERQMIGRSDS